MTRLQTSGFIAIAALILTYVGASILFTPVGFYAANGTMLEHQPNILSEVRASGGLLLGSGIAIFLSLFIPTLRRQALGLSSLVYLTYGFARVFSMLLDGMPSMSLTLSAGVEILIGALSALVWTRITETIHP